MRVPSSTSQAAAPRRAVLDSATCRRSRRSPGHLRPANPASSSCGRSSASLPSASKPRCSRSTRVPSPSGVKSHLDLGRRHGVRVHLPLQDEPVWRLPGADVGPVRLFAGAHPLVDPTVGACLEDDRLGRRSPLPMASTECVSIGHQVADLLREDLERPLRASPATTADFGITSPVSLRAHSLLLSFACDGRLEALERRRPERVEVGAELAQPVRIEPVDAARAFMPLRHEPRLLQHTQVLRDCRAADRKLTGELARRPGGRSGEARRSGASSGRPTHPLHLRKPSLTVSMDLQKRAVKRRPSYHPARCAIPRVYEPLSGRAAVGEASVASR